MNEREFNEKAKDLIKVNGFELVVVDTTPNITYDGIEYFRNVLSFNVNYEGKTYMTFYLENNGKVKSVKYVSRYSVDDKAIGMAVRDVLSIVFGKKFRLREGRR